MLSTEEELFEKKRGEKIPTFYTTEKKTKKEQKYKRERKTKLYVKVQAGKRQMLKSSNCGHWSIVQALRKTYP